MQINELIFIILFSFKLHETLIHITTKRLLLMPTTLPISQRFLLLLLVNDVDDNLAWDGSYNVIFETNNNNNNDGISDP